MLAFLVTGKVFWPFLGFPNLRVIYSDKPKVLVSELNLIAKRKLEYKLEIVNLLEKAKQQTHYVMNGCSVR